MEEYVQCTIHFERVIPLGQFAGCCHVVTYVRCQAGISGVSQANLLREGLLSTGGESSKGDTVKELLENGIVNIQVEKLETTHSFQSLPQHHMSMNQTASNR